MVLSWKNFFFDMTEYFEVTEWLGKLKFGEVTYSPTEFSFL